MWSYFNEQSSTEVVEFWKACDDYRKLSGERRGLAARAIAMRFLGVESFFDLDCSDDRTKNYISVPDRLRKRVALRLASADVAVRSGASVPGTVWPIDLFEESRAHSFNEFTVRTGAAERFLSASWCALHRSFRQRCEILGRLCQVASRDGGERKDAGAGAPSLFALGGTGAAATMSARPRHVFRCIATIVDDRLRMEEDPDAALEATMSATYARSHSAGETQTPPVGPLLHPSAPAPIVVARDVGRGVPHGGPVAGAAAIAHDVARASLASEGRRSNGRGLVGGGGGAHSQQAHLRKHEGAGDGGRVTDSRPLCRIYDRDSGEWRRRRFRLPPSALTLQFFEDVPTSSTPVLVVPLLAHTVILFGAVVASVSSSAARGHAFVMPATAPRHFETQGLVVACLSDEDSVRRFAERNAGDVTALPPVAVALILEGDAEVGHWYGALQMSVQVNAGLLDMELDPAARRLRALCVVARVSARLSRTRVGKATT